MKAVPRSRYLVFAGIVCGGCGADLATKTWMFSRLGMPGNPTQWLWPGVFGLQASLNEGALFGMGQGRVFIFALLSMAAAVGIVAWLFLGRAATDRLLTVALWMVTAGILGNLYDRLGLPGLKWHFTSPTHQIGDPVYAVRDWILVMIGQWPWPNFNIADSLLVSGAILLAWQAVRTEEGERKEDG
jgi:signal peptidase II